MNTVAAQQAPTQLTDTRADLSLLKAIVNDVLSDTEYVIRLGNSQLNAITGVLLPPLGLHRSLAPTCRRNSAG